MAGSATLIDETRNGVANELSTVRKSTDRFRASSEEGDFGWPPAAVTLGESGIRVASRVLQVTEIHSPPL